MPTPTCPQCRAPMTDLGGLGSSPKWECHDPDCPTNWQRHLRCPTKACGGRELTEKTIGLAHQVYECQRCGFAFDPLQQAAVYECDGCHKHEMKITETQGGFFFTCPGCPFTIAVPPKK